MPKLTKRTVDSLKPGEADYFVWDAEIIGFGVRVMPSGAKTYQVACCRFRGQQVKLA